MNFLYTLISFVVSLGVLVAFHEFGHFWVARLFGVKVLRFSVGFGKILWSRQKSPEHTQFALSAIPLGGYVKMVDEREGEVAEKDLPFAFNRKPVWVRALVVAAGPLFNLGLAVLLFWSVLVIGEEDFRPLLGVPETGSYAASAGFADGDEILAVNGKTTPTWTEAMGAVVTAALDSDTEIMVTVKSQAGDTANKTLRLPEDAADKPSKLFDHLGFKPWSPKLPAVIGQLLPDGAAVAAGFKTNDLIISANGVEIKDWLQWVDIVKAHPGRPVTTVLEREGVRMTLTVLPKSVPVEAGGDAKEGKIGAGVFVPEALRNSLKVDYVLPPLAAIPVAFQTTYHYSWATLKMMGKMLIGKASVENLSGPISIAQFAGQSAKLGLVPFLKFLALVSVSLGVLNLLPIPVLDGGQLLFFSYEAMTGQPLPDRWQLSFQQMGIALLLSVMLLAMVLDTQRLFH